MSITGTVQTITDHESKSGATYWKVKVNGKEYTTFKDEAIDGLAVGMNVRADVTEQKKGNYTNLYWNSWEEVSGVPPAKQSGHGPSGPSPEVFEARDRRIAMEASYASATRFMAALATTKPENVTTLNLRSLARSIYADVVKAGEGSKFQGAEPGRGAPPDEEQS